MVATHTRNARHHELPRVADTATPGTCCQTWLSWEGAQMPLRTYFLKATSFVSIVVVAMLVTFPVSQWEQRVAFGCGGSGYIVLAPLLLSALLPHAVYSLYGLLRAGEFIQCVILPDNTARHVTTLTSLTPLVAAVASVHHRSTENDIVAAGALAYTIGMHLFAQDFFNVAISQDEDTWTQTQSVKRVLPLILGVVPLVALMYVLIGVSSGGSYGTQAESMIVLATLLTAFAVASAPALTAPSNKAVSNALTYYVVLAGQVVIALMIRFRP